MASGLDLRLNSLSGLEDDLRTALGTGSGALSSMFDTSGVGDVFGGTVFRDIWDRSGLSALSGPVDIRNLNDLGNLAGRLPGGLGQPDSTGEVPTGFSDIPRHEIATMATLAAAPRIADALGPTAQTVLVGGETFTILGRYDDPVTGFSALRLDHPNPNGPDIFVIDGLEVGSRPDEVTAATLGRLQVESSSFNQMVADAVASAWAGGAGVEFVGPSLGGAIAEVAAHEAAQGLLARGGIFPNGAVRLVTVDGLGGRDAAETINGGKRDAAALQIIDAVNIRTDGDIVSRIGSHIGATVTLPALDAQGHVVQLDPADAHVNVVSLLQNLSSDQLYAAGVRGAPAEISGFAAASNAASDQVIQAWLASGESDTTQRELQIPGTAAFDPTGTVWVLDADDNGTTDIAVTLSAPVDPGRADLVLG
ncbi:hypothetical protein [Falsiroseomonas sp. HW251]|uniref:hypothetical protein n=1 Tax=Falsiroseomonas sp. HW251 TaxID=3390998 RepID=UPI003D32374A